MLIYIFILLILMAGVSLGLAIGLIMLRPKEAPSKFVRAEERIPFVMEEEHNSKKKKKRKKTPIQTKEESLEKNEQKDKTEEDVASQKQSILSKKIEKKGPKPTSVRDLNYIMQGLDPDEAVKTRQKTEDRAYQILKNKKKATE